MDYSFNVEVAMKYGVPEAIFLHNLYFWIAKNEANGRHYHEDKDFPGTWRHWTYNSAAALAKLFPFWSEDQIRRLTRKMKDNGLIHVGSYNKKGMDRTLWYALSDEVLEIYHSAKPQDHLANSPVPSCETAPPIPDSKPYSKHIYKDIVEYLNRKTGKAFKESSRATRDCIRARLNEGFELSDFQRVIDSKCRDWKGDPVMSKYLRPCTLFGTKFESYLNEPQPESRWKQLD